MIRRSHVLVCVAFLLLLAACGGAEASDSPLRQGREVYGNICSACHGSNGQGGIGPALADVAKTFPSCDEHVEWITLGSDQWKIVHGDTYGANDSPIEQVMPGQGATLSAEQIKAVAAYERVFYGGMDEGTALDECGVSTPGSSE
ncbi:MAG: cytochrome c [Acidimicrobiia bacterium]|nr:cytochrome c [Acidimicrobiia bacterium]